MTVFPHNPLPDVPQSVAHVSAPGRAPEDWQPIDAGDRAVFTPTEAIKEAPEIMARGGIVGVCNLVGVIDRGTYKDRAYPSDPAHRIESPWYTGSLGLMLADVRPLPFVPVQGALGFFDVPDHLVPESAVMTRGLLRLCGHHTPRVRSRGGARDEG